MYEATYDTTNYVFEAYLAKKVKKNKPIYNLFAEGFISVKSFCLLMMNQAWSQAAIILRTLLEEVATLFVLSFNEETVDEYLKFNQLKREYYCLEGKEEQNKFIKDHNLKENPTTMINYLNYGWVKRFTKTGTYGRNQLISLAKLDEFLVDIKWQLNHFAHGDLTIFDFNYDNWKLMKRYGERIIMICAKLFDFLVCSYSRWVGKEFTNITTKNLFEKFIYLYRKINNN